GGRLGPAGFFVRPSVREWKRPKRAPRPPKYPKNVNRLSLLNCTPVPSRHTKPMSSANVSSNLTLALGLPVCAPMRFPRAPLVFAPLVAAVTLLGQSVTPVSDSPINDAAYDLNVNSRYTIESINFVD